MVSTSKADGNQKTVLVCDDQKDIVQACAICLRRSYNVLKATSGRECISICEALRGERARLDLLLLDFELGDATAEDISRDLQANFGRETRIVLITAHELDHIGVEKFLKNNPNAVELRKPFSLEQLLETVTRALA